MKSPSCFKSVSLSRPVGDQRRVVLPLVVYEFAGRSERPDVLTGSLTSTVLPVTTATPFRRCVVHPAPPAGVDDLDSVSPVRRLGDRGVRQECIGS